jgi:hypothetical protein
VLVTPTYNPNETPYKSPLVASTADRHFLPGPGEAIPLQSMSLHLEGVIRIEGHLLRSEPSCLVQYYFSLNAHTVSVSPRKDYILFSTRNPPAIQRIPWPTVDEETELDVTRRRRRSWTGYDTWLINEHDFPWLADADGPRIPSPPLLRTFPKHSHLQ